ncbi:MAG: SagB/ThcOx family dehydrogenase [Nitrospira sp.]|nr:SagB/ThcOx family dehydrogenase [Candidatus Manganitrophaceae bacterium]HIL35816.1 SagB/ThcOx family dehydrogenase [Candidatus Manganitrophaceae bacterium]
MRKKPISEIYHQETKYNEAEMEKHQRPLDWASTPSPFKSYHSDKKIDLMSYLPFKNNPFTGEAMAPVGEEAYASGLGPISRLLYFTNGVTGILKYPHGQSVVLRAAPTAGGLYPTEIYLAIRKMPKINDGIYNFQVKDHSLVPVWEGDFWDKITQYCLGHEALGQSNLLMIMTAVYQRSVWRYRERAYRRILLDTGHVLGNVIAYAPEGGFSPYPIGGFIDPFLNHLLFLDESKEGVLMVIALPQGKSLDPDKIKSTPTAKSLNERVEEEKMPELFHRLHHTSSILPVKNMQRSPAELPEAARLDLRMEPAVEDISVGLEEKRAVLNESTLMPSLPIEWKEGVGHTILLRRSTRVFSGEALLKDELASILEYAYLPLKFRPPPLFDPSLLETYLVIQKVVGFAEGIYHYAPLERAFRMTRPGDYRKLTWHFCLGQTLARDAAALVIHVAHLGKALERHGDRAYRYLHLDAGHIGERMNLAAIQLQLGVSGIGGFYDDEVNALLGLSLDQIIVYITTLGRPLAEAKG